VFSASDRLRRVLSDGALPEGAPPLARGPVRPGPDPVREARLAALRARLAALGVAAPRAPAQAYAPPATAGGGGGGDHRAETTAPLEALVAGALVDGPAGVYVRTERRFPLESLHGRVVLAEALAHPIPLRAKERGPGQARTLDLAHTAFLDTETTGLSGGTGTVAFLVGVGRVEGDAFVVRQYGLRDYPEEPALLRAVAADLGDLPLVTFNGRAFDWPLLLTRFSLHRLKVRERGHLDLLPQARRLWAGSLPSHSLATLERHVLGVEREDDLPGAEIPAAWFRYVRTGAAGPVARAFRHNETDVVSMLALLARVGAVLGGAAPSLTACPRDHLGTARLLLEHGHVERARRCVDAGLALANGADARPLLHLKADLAKRAGEHGAALEAWAAARAAAADLDVPAHVEAAKLLEHRLGRHADALALTVAALERAPAGHAEHAALEHRAARLRRKLTP
jgi:uncharacterized protein YprB with RNaseH-like and TPR domain